MTEVFRVETSLPIEEALKAGNALTREPLITESRMLKGGICNETAIRALWQQKTRIDALFDTPHREAEYHRTRDRLFPLDKHGSERGLKNRAGDKLIELHEALIHACDNDSKVKHGILVPRTKTDDDVFFDICGGPGSWSELMLRETTMSGFGITLCVGMTKNAEIWYEPLHASPRWRALWSSDDDGNVYSATNLQKTRDDLRYQRVVLAVGDGGFKLGRDENGVHQENFQELYSARIVLSELMFAVTTLVEGGHYVCKLFDVFSQLTASVVYATALLFEETYIVKPRHSRIVNSERYLVGRFRRRRTDHAHAFVESLCKVHAEWDRGAAVSPAAPTAAVSSTSSSSTSSTSSASATARQSSGNGIAADVGASEMAPVAIVSPELMNRDEKFRASLSACATQLCERQTAALKQVMDEIDAKHLEKTAAAAAAAEKKKAKQKQPAVVDDDGFTLAVRKK